VKLTYLFIAILIVIAGCASSNNGDEAETYPNLVSLQQPDDQPHKPSKVYIDSVKQITVDEQPALLISGTLPDACTNLQKVTHSISQNKLSMEITAWRNPDKMCAQVLSPFSFIYEGITKKELSNQSSAFINGTEFKF